MSLIRGADGGAAHCCHEHEGPRLFHPCSVPAGDRAHVLDCAGRISRMEALDDTDLVLERAAWLRHWHVQRGGMESTSTYWKGVYYLLEAEGFDCGLVNGREVKNVPGRAKTDRADAIWLAKVAERGMCRPS